MSPIPLPSQTLAWLNHAAAAGQSDALVMLHLVGHADKRDKDVAKFLDSYTDTIAALCRRLDALERGVNLHMHDEAVETIADAAQRITDHAVQADLTVQDWVTAFNAAPVNDMEVPSTKPTAEDMLPKPLTESELRQSWNRQADDYNNWDSLSVNEQLAWAQTSAIAALKAEPEGKSN